MLKNKQMTNKTTETVEAKEAVVASDVQEVIDARAEAKEAEVAPGLVEISKDNGTSTFTDSVTEKVTESEGETVLVSSKPAPLNSEVIDGVFVDEVETPVVVRETRIIDTRLNRAGVDAYLARLKGTNPKKYALKKVELEAKLEATEAKVKADAAAKKAEEKAAKKHDK